MRLFRLDKAVSARPLLGDSAAPWKWPVLAERGSRIVGTLADPLLDPLQSLVATSALLGLRELGIGGLTSVVSVGRNHSSLTAIAPAGAEMDDADVLKVSVGSWFRPQISRIATSRRPVVN